VRLFEKTKPIGRPTAGNLCLRYPKSEYLNPKQFEEVCLKKQSQYQNGQNGVSSVLAMIYEHFRDLWWFWVAKNKANSPDFGRKFEVRSSKSETTKFIINQVEKTKPIFTSRNRRKRL
jgi:hypothetical protein